MKSTKAQDRLSLSRFVLALIAVALLCLVTAVCLLADGAGVAYAAGTAQDAITDDTYADYTDSDYLYGGGMQTIRDYPNIRTIPDISNFRLNTVTDDAIIKIVPKELFKKIGEELYIGKEYGFFIHSEACPDRAGGNNVYSTVMVFDVINTTDMDTNQGTASFEVEVLYQYEYIYLSPSESSFCVLNNLGDFLTTGIDYSVGDIVIPLGRGTAINPHYDEVESYYLSDISFSGAVENEQNLNYGDTGYIDKDDKGVFFSGANYYYDGIKVVNGSINQDEAIDWGINMFFALAGVVSSSVPPLGLAVAAGNIIYITLDVLESRQTEYIDVTNKKIIISPQYNTALEQLQHDGHLCKFIALAINTDVNQGCIYGSGDSAEIHFDISSTPDSKIWQARLTRSIALTVLNSHLQPITTQAFNHSFSLYDEENENVKYGENANTAYLLPNGENTFAIIPDFSGEYIADFGANSDIKLELNDKEIAAENDGFHLQLNAGTLYKLRVINKTDERLIRGFSVEPAEKTAVTIGGKGSYIVKKTFDTPELYRIATNNQNVTADVYILNEQGAFEKYRPEGFDVTAASAIEFPFVAGNYFIVLYNNSSSSAAAGITFGDVSELDAETNAVEFDANRHFYKFVPAYESYVFTLTTESEYVNLGFFAGNMQPVYVSSGSNAFRADNLVPGNEYYFAIRSADGTYGTGVVTVKRSNAAFKWYIDGEPADNSKDVVLERSWAYEIECRINETIIIKEFTQSTGGSSVNYLTHDASAIFNIGIPKDVPLDTKITLMPVMSELAVYRSSLNIVIVANSKVVVDDIINYEEEMGVYLTVNDPDITAVSYKYDYKNFLGIKHSGSGTESVVKDSKNKMSFRFYFNYAIVYDAVFSIVSVTYKGQEIEYGNEFTTIPFDVIVGTGDGTEESPFLITCARHFATLEITAYQEDNSNLYWKLAANIDLNDPFVVAVDVMLDKFYGHFDGGGYKLSGLTIEIPAKSYNFDMNFGWVKENHGTIKNVTFSNVSIYAPIWHEGAGVRIGIVAGVNASDGIIENVNLEECVIDTNRNDASIGGFAGVNDGVIRNCKIGTLIDLQELSIFGNGDAGFICGTNTGVIDGCQICWALMRHYPSVNNRSVGAAVGYCTDGTIKNCQFAFCSIEVTGCDAGIVPNIGKLIGHVTSRVQVENNNILVVVDIDNLPEGQRGHCCAAGDDGAYGYYENV